MKMSVRILRIPKYISSSYSYSYSYSILVITSYVYIGKKKFQIEHYLNLSIHFVEIFERKRLLWERDFE